MTRPRRASVVRRLAGYERLVEVGIGNRTDLAAALADRGCRVTATDIERRDTPPGVQFVRDDVTDPDLAVYDGAGALYMRNCPPELQRPLAATARAVGADCLFTTLGGDPTVVPVEREAVEGDTLFLASGAERGGRA